MSKSIYPQNQPLPQAQVQAQAQFQGQTQDSQNLQYFKPAAHIPDQVHTPEGEVKPEWQYLLNSIQNLGSDGLNARTDKARRILRDDGVTYNIYGKDKAPGSQWELDLVPSVISSEDWADIESGLLERAELFNLMLRDFYGSRTLLKQLAIPPEALFGHGGFLRACQGIQVPGEHDLILHSVDLVRRPDGTMCVLSDRTQAPSGAGYVLENRTVMSRVFPSLFRDSHVHRLASFFQRLRHKLISLAPSENKARVVVLTPGPHNETYFEHSYISNYLGFPLVQSGDLVVRKGFVWMKSLDGLDRVDVILRRIDDVSCDPVELYSGSQLGVPGLLDVVRAGRVVMANPLGTGVLENPILLKYLPQISKALLGRELRLKSVKTYWCGDKDDLKFISENIKNLIIKPIYRGTGAHSVWGGDLSDSELAELLQKIHQKPLQFVAQERIDKTHIPSLTKDNTLEPRPAILRTFSVATDNSYMVMPGGLTRVGLSAGSPLISMQIGCPSKDTWVTASEPERIPDESQQDALQAEKEAMLVSLPSRVVENLFWMGRYAERAEASLRLLRTVFEMLNDEQAISAQSQKVLLNAISEITATLPGFVNAPEELLANPEPELLDIIKNGARMGSIKSTLNSLFYCADESKELLSSDTIRIINDLQDEVDNLEMSLSQGLSSAPEEALDPLVIPLIALSGIMQESMVRGVGWHFLEMGRRVERSAQIMKTVSVLMTDVSEKYDHRTLLNALLKSMEVSLVYRRQGRARAGLELGIELVMLDSTNPRSLMFQFERLQHHFDNVRNDNQGKRELDEEDRVLLEAVTSLKLSRVKSLVEEIEGTRPNLSKIIGQLSVLLNDFNNVITDKYFDHRIDPKQLVGTFVEEAH
ncbi:circularly permuted type 2 ATP-grasp protein [Oceaniserpentilla sp. 4NH20-0058]|uniref:circularly permuted type 2 ATP-grasp protein n=1 Tax=Oceaniserpentilla sp. 4NH20-0058 TaxID=3127660 RepID=UPI00310B0F97